MIFEANYKDYYIPMIDEIVKKHFPEYYDEVKSLPKYKRKGLMPLDNNEILELYFKYKNEGDMAARDRLIYSQLSLVCYYTNKFHKKCNGSNLSADDLIGFANEILVDIIDKYDPYYNKTEKQIKEGKINTLPSFVRRRVKNELHKDLKNYGLLVRLPHNQIDEITYYRKVYSKFCNQYGREPYDGESIEFIGKVKGENIKSIKKAVFSLNEGKIHVYLKQDEDWIYEFSSNIRDKQNIVSGNSQIGEGDTEYFDLLKDESTIEDEQSNVVKDSLREALQELTERERKMLEMKYLNKMNQKTIPYILEPDEDNPREIKSLRDTSYNRIYIYIDNNGVEEVIDYTVVANYHVENESNNEIDSDIYVPITHKHREIFTTSQADRYIFNLTRGRVIKVIHQTKKKEFEVEYNQTGKVFSFDIEYNYGEIFCSQTFSNKLSRVTKKLRKKLIKLKPYLYEN